MKCQGKRTRTRIGKSEIPMFIVRGGLTRSSDFTQGMNE